MRRVLISTFGLAVCLATAAAAAERAAPAPWLEPCKLEGVEGRVWCGTYRVFENRAAASGRQIEINVVIAAALGDAPRPDPIFFFAGGPGLGAAQGTLPMSHALAPLREQRDLVFIDQRGTGASHPLACPLAEDAPLQQFFESLYEPRRARECRLQLGGQADLAQYANPVAMDDIEEVREALGYSRINLLGVSYGGRSALVYLRQHGEHVRAAVLKGPAPPNEEPVIVVSFARKTDRALRAAFDACRSQPECHAAYPRLEEEWQNVIAMVETGQVSATVADPRSGEAVEVYIRPLFFKDGVRRILYDLASEPARRLPRADPRGLTRRLLTVREHRPGADHGPAPDHCVGRLSGHHLRRGHSLHWRERGGTVDRRHVLRRRPSASGRWQPARLGARGQTWVRPSEARRTPTCRSWCFRGSTTPLRRRRRERLRCAWRVPEACT